MPGGRTHRLAPMLAGMLRYAVEQSTRKGRRPRPSGALVEALIALDEGDDDAAVLATAAVQRLFRYAGVRAARASRNGEYSIVEAAISRVPTVGRYAVGMKIGVATHNGRPPAPATAGRFARCVG